MKIIYDSEAPAYKTVTIIADNGKEHTCGCYEIKVETTVKGQPHQELKFSRWGNIKKRNSIHQKVQELLTQEESERWNTATDTEKNT